jgi:hypothetical protein
MHVQPVDFSRLLACAEADIVRSMNYGFFEVSWADYCAPSFQRALSLVAKPRASGASVWSGVRRFCGTSSFRQRIRAQSRWISLALGSIL